MIYTLAKKLSMTLMLLAFTTNILKADMMFYYSAAVLPSIVGKKAETPIKPMVSFKDNEHGFEPWLVDIENNEAHMVKDIHTKNADAVIPDMFVTIDGITYFFADDGINGYGLWKTDGSEEGTVLVKNYHNTMTPLSIFEFKGLVYFTIDIKEDKAGGWLTRNYSELWKSDGSTVGTESLTKSLLEKVENVTVVDDTIYFSGGKTVEAGQDFYYQLWKSDGSTIGTEQITNINGYGPNKLVNVDGVLYFRFFTNSPKTKYLYRTDGTMEGTVSFPETNIGPDDILVELNKQLLSVNTAENTFKKFDGTKFVLVKYMGDNVNVYGSVVHLKSITQANDFLYFIAFSGEYGNELWRTDGTTEGTSMIEGEFVNEGNMGSEPSHLAYMNGTLYFQHSYFNGSYAQDIWAVEDNTTTARKVIDGIDVVQYMKSIKNKLYIRTKPNGSTSTKLRVSDGTQEGTIVLKEFSDQSNVTTSTIYTIRNKLALISECGTKVCNFANDGGYGFELWATDGSVSGTKLLKNINQSTKNSVFMKFNFSDNQQYEYNEGTGFTPSKEYAKINHKYIFIGRDGSMSNLGHDNHSEFFLSDGTEDGTEKITINGERLSADVYTYGLFTLKNSLLYFIGKYNDDFYLCKTNGTGEGTDCIKKMGQRGSGSVKSLKNYNGMLYFNWKNELWKSDGTEVGTTFIKDVELEIIHLFSSKPDNLYVRTINALWMKDNNISDFKKYSLNTNGTAYSEKIFHFKGTDYLSTFSQYHTTMSFSKIDSTRINEVILLNKRNSINFLEVIGDNFYFDADDQKELWKSDGTQTGTILIKNNFSYGSLTQFVEVNNTLFFVAGDELHGTELWKSNGTTEGTVMIKDIRVGPLSSEIRILNVEKDKLLFTVKNEEGLKLWVSDGTEAGTKVMDTSNNI